MQNIEIQINGQRVDSDKNRIPLVFSRRIDLWDSFIGSEGTQAKSLNDTLYLPATKNNSAILANFDIYDYDSSNAQGLLFVQVFVNAVSVFAGYGQRISASKIGTQSDTFAIKILGDSVDVFTQLAGLSLRDLPMGSAPTTPADINASWSPLAITTNPLIFAPAFYGGATYTGVTVAADNATYLRGLRPCVRIWNILEAIFEKQLGYKIVSNFYQTEAFRNLVYPFGVGDAWLRTDAVANFNCYVGAANQSFPAPVQQVKFPIETPPYNDPLGLNILAGTFDPTPFGAGWYVFTFKINTNNNVDRVVLRGQSVTPPVVNINLGEYEPNTLVITEPIYFEPSVGLRRMIFTVEGTNSPMTVSADSYYQAQLIDRFAYGAPLAIASCLHDKPQKDFLRGLQHAFGLVIGIDNVSKNVYIDPRFNNATQPAVVPEGLFLSSEGYYNPNADAEILAVDIAETALQHQRPFGDTLKLAYGEDSSDVYYEYILEQAQADYSLYPLMGSKITFVPADKAGVTIRNPFFTYLMNVRIQPDISIPRQTVMPCMVQDLAELKNSNLNQNTPPLYECEPKLAMYYGTLDFSSPIYTNYYQWSFLDYANDTFSLINFIPTFFQVFPDSAGYFSAFGDIPFSLSYTSLVYNNYPTPPFTILGLIDRFHSKYLSIIYNDKWYNLTARVKLDDYRTDLFKSPKLFNIGGQLIKCWQVSTEKFNPTDSDKADILVIADYDNIKSSTYSEEADGGNPLLTIGYIFELTTIQ
jgi:hypothetical protein